MSIPCKQQRGFLSGASFLSFVGHLLVGIFFGMPESLVELRGFEPLA